LAKGMVRRMKRLLCIVGVLLLLASGASAQTVPADASLRGEVVYPQGSSADTASFTYSYRLPRFTQEQPQSEAINAYFAAYAAELENTVIPQTAAELNSLPAAGEPAYYVDMDYSITENTADTLSVLLVSQEFLGNTLMESWSSVVFAISGIYAGQPITLSQAMGLEQTADDLTQDTASELVYGLVWQIVQYEIAAMQKAYFPDVTEADFRRAFTPEQDFYFDGDGNFVFFMQAGTIAGEVEGVLTFPFSLAELLSAIGKG
jgi:hypothetical protein